MPETLPRRFAHAMAALNAPHQLGLAVSGGGDSMAMLHLASGWAQAQGARLCVATIDHGLRSESRSEAILVQRVCAELGWPHDILTWDHGAVRGNLQANARQARHALLHHWVMDQGTMPVMMAHTADDQAETVLMRLKRGSGVDGLAGMESNAQIGGMQVLRPMLGFDRAELRGWLRAHDHRWIDDPSNQEARFDRVATRQAMTALGLDPRRLSLAAEHMANARAVLQDAAAALAEHGVTEIWSCLALDRMAFQDARQETRERVWAGAVRWLTGTQYKPRLEGLRRAIALADHGEVSQLAGVVAIPAGDRVWLARDYAALPPHALGPSLVRDGLSLRPAGPEGLRALPDWRGRLPRRAALAEPMVFRGEQPLAFLQSNEPITQPFQPSPPKQPFAKSLR